jgi:hypothetical protein
VTSETNDGNVINELCMLFLNLGTSSCVWLVDSTRVGFNNRSGPNRL